MHPIEFLCSQEKMSTIELEKSKSMGKRVVKVQIDQRNSDTLWYDVRASPKSLKVDT
jgi:hypothetical protein